MAKKMKKIFAMLLVVSMLIGMMPVQALAEENVEAGIPADVDVTLEIAEDNTVVVTFGPAAEETEEEVSEEAPASEEEVVSEEAPASEEDVVSEETPVSDENVDIEVPTGSLEWESELTFGEGITAEVTDVKSETVTTEEGDTVVTESATIETEGQLDENTTIAGEESCTETVVTEADGTVTETQNVTGSEITEEVIEDDTDDAHLNPEVEVELIPGETTTTTVVEETTETEGDLPENEEDENFDYTITETTTERVVEVTTSDIEISETAGELDMNPIVPEDYEGKVNASIDAARPFGPENAGVKYVEVPVTDDEGNPMSDEEGNPLMIKIPDPETWNDSWDYQYLDKGERSTSGSVFTAKLEFVKDEEGNFVYDENGFVKWTWAETWGNPNPQPNTTLSKQVGTTMHALWDKNGNIVFTYCMDKGTNVDTNYGYIMENLDDADYIPNGGSKEKLRAIVENGYWGTEEGVGSLEKIKADMTDAINNGLEMEFSFKREDGKVFEYTTKTEEGKALILDMISKMNEGDALTSTQGAIWSYSNGYANGLTGNETLYEHWLNGNIFYGFQTQSSWYGAPKWEKNDPYYEERNVTGGAAGRMWIMYHYLMSLEGYEQTETTILNKESFLSEEGMQLIVGDKVADAEENMDDNGDNDVFNVALSFTMVVEPSTENGDDLVVALYDGEGNLIRKARLAGNGENDGDEFSEIEKVGSTYTFRDIPVAENSDITFDLRLDGLQNLQHGVYIYKSVDENGDSNFDKSQTLIGLSQGKQDVHINTKFTLNFDVDENSVVRSKRVWNRTSDPVVTEPERNYHYAPPTETIIEDEPVPLADVPQTGDNSVVWFAMILLAGLGLCVIELSGKKCKA